MEEENQFFCVTEAQSRYMKINLPPQFGYLNKNRDEKDKKRGGLLFIF